MHLLNDIHRKQLHGFLRLIAFAATAGLGSLHALDLASPDGNIILHFDVKDRGALKNCPVYNVTYRNRTVIAESRLGLELDGASLDSGLRVVDQTTSRQDSTWKPVCGERDIVRDHYNQATVDLRQERSPSRSMGITFRAYDAGIAFCYTLPTQDGLKDFTIKVENTQFGFADDDTAWAVYQAQGDYSKAGNGPTPLSRLRSGVERPLTVRLADDLYASITEARTVDYARMKLRPAKDQPLTLDAFLDAERGQYGTVAGSTPFTSPWRVVMIAQSPGKLLEQDDLILNLNDPCVLADTSWIKPGKVIRETTITTAGAKACIDFCVQQGMQYILFDDGWYVPGYGKQNDPAADARVVVAKLDLPAVIAYGNAKNIGVILYVDHRQLETQLADLLPLYQQWGVKGIKFGFVSVGSQHWTAWLHDAIRQAAAHKLMVDIHDEFRSTGYERTYPNLMTVEGIGGDETFPTPVHNATLPFTRFLTGAADHTFCWYDKRLAVTHAHQLAISTIFFSPWQCLYWYDRPGQYNRDPALDYWKELPTTWDETRVVQGEIGKSVTIARRHGADWYVGSIHADGRAGVNIPLSFLKPGKPYTATIYRDGKPDDPASKEVKIETQTVDAGTILKADIPANGGEAVRLVPAS